MTVFSTRQCLPALHRATRVALCASLPLLSLTANAQVMVDVAPCLSLGSELERFVCYERQVEAAGGRERLARQAPTSRAPANDIPVIMPSTPRGPAPATQASAPAPAAEPAPAANSREAAIADFGLPEDRQQRQKEEVTELMAVVSDLEETVPNAFLITLDNGQVWRQVRPEAGYRLRPGYEVRIYPSRWGDDFRLSATKLRGFIQVERVR